MDLFSLRNLFSPLVDFFVGITAVFLSFTGITASGPTIDADLSRTSFSWSVTEATDVTITALTDSPAVPGASQDLAEAHPFSGTLDTLFGQNPQPILDELKNNGVPNASFDPNSPGLIDGFNQTQTVANRICDVYFQGSHNAGYATKRYKSPKDNTILDFDGARWTQSRASTFPDKGRHIDRGARFTCERDISIPPLSGMHTFSPPLPVGTHTYRLIAQGPSGTNTLDVTIVVPASEENGPEGNEGSGSSGSGTGTDTGTGEPPAPQCSDGIDNNGNGLIDYPGDASCASPADNYEEAPAAPEASVSLTGDALVRAGTAAQLSWSAENVEADSCSVSGTNGDSRTLSGTSGTLTTSALQSETVFTLSCTDLNGDPVSTARTVKITPSFEEI